MAKMTKKDLKRLIRIKDQDNAELNDVICKLENEVKQLRQGWDELVREKNEMQMKLGVIKKISK